MFMKVLLNIVLIGIGWCIGERLARKYKTRQRCRKVKQGWKITK